jgi:centriolar protein POC1
MKFELHGVLEGHEHPIYALSASSKEHILFSGGGEGAVVEWSLKTMKPIKIMYKTRASIYSIHCPKALPLLVSGDREGKISIFNFIDQKLVYQEKLAGAGIFGMLSHQHKLYFVSEDGYLRCFDLERLSLEMELKISEQALRCISINVEDEMMYLSGKDLKIHHYSINENRVVRSEEQHSLPVFSLEYDSENKQLLSGARDAQIKVWRITETINLAAHMFAVNKILSIPEHDIFISASMDKSIKMWDAKSLDLLSIADPLKNQGHHKSVNTLCYTPYEQLVASAGDDRMIKVWRLVTSD